MGPPGECAGVYGHVRDSNVTLHWTTGPDHGSVILGFTVYFNTGFNSAWRPLVEHVQLAEVTLSSNPRQQHQECVLDIPDLKPGSSYRFRVAAFNVYGFGPVSMPSMLYKIVDAPPVVEVTGIREGGSTVGTLPIEWDALSDEDLTGNGTGYRVYYRLKDLSNRNHWRREDVMGNVNSHVAFVGALNYFLPYEVKVAPFNYLGHGPNSSIETLMSAEDIPIATATDITGDSVNASAIMVYWTPIPPLRRYIRGRILGYQVNYWTWSESHLGMGGVNIYCDNCGEGLIIGLDPNEDYWLNVQVFTKGGTGPMSEIGFTSTYIFPALAYPKHVRVASYPGHAVYVTWQGVHISLLEEHLSGK